MSWFNLSLTKGIVNTRGEDVLQPGELISGSGFRFKINDSFQIHKDVGHQLVYNAAPNSTLNGLHYLGFENFSDQLLHSEIDTGGLVSFYTGAASISSLTPSVKDSFQSSSFLGFDICHRGDEYFLGQNIPNFLIHNASEFTSNRVISTRSGAVTMRPMGMKRGDSTSGGFTVTNNTINNAFPDTHLVWYFITEYDSDNDIESQLGYDESSTLRNKHWSYNIVLSGTDASMIVDTAGWVRENSNADKLRIYRFVSAKSGTALNLGRYLDEDRFNLMLKSQGALVQTIDMWGSYDDDPAGIEPGLLRYPVLQGFNATYDLYRTPRNFDLCIVHRDSIVTNSIDENGSIIRWGQPGFPEYQPDPYNMFITTEKSDKLIGMISFKNSILAFLAGSVHRINYLPLEQDLAQPFTAELVDEITSKEGLVSRQAYQKITTNSGELVVWLAQQGLRATDGDSVVDIAPNWSVEGAGHTTLSSADLYNNERYYRLELRLEGVRWDFYYHRVHADGGFTVVGPHPDLGFSFSDGLGPLGWYASDVTGGKGIYANNLGLTENPMLLETGQLTSGIPLQLIKVDFVGLTHNAVIGADLKIGYKSKVAGEAVVTDDVEMTGMEFQETGRATLQTNGNYVKLSIEESSSLDHSWGPLWIDGDKIEGGA